MIGKNFFLCFLTIFSSFLLSCCFSYDPFRSLLASGAGVLTYVCFFLVPINLIYLFGREQVLRLYFLSFLFVGLHALSQCALSLLDIHDPFATQFVPVANVARGQSFTYEPSYYALFAVPFAFFFNTRFLLSAFTLQNLWKVIGVNILLLTSISTGAFFSYFIFFATVLVLSCFSCIKTHFPQLRKKIMTFCLGFCLLFASVSLIFLELFLHTFYKFFYFGLLSHWSSAERFDRIIEGWKIFCAHPLFGIGLRNVEHYLYLQAHFNETQAPLFYEKLNTRELFNPYASSNILVEILASLGLYGLLGFILFGLLVWRAFFQSFQDRRIAHEEQKNLFALFVSLIVMLICLQFNQELFRNYVWIHMGISLGYLLNVRSELPQA